MAPTLKQQGYTDGGKNEPVLDPMLVHWIDLIFEDIGKGKNVAHAIRWA